MEIIIFCVVALSFFISFFSPRIVLLVSIAVFPFYKILGTFSISEAEISIFDGLIMVLFIATLMKLPIMLKRVKIIRLDFVMVFWVIINLFSFLFYRDDLIYGLNIFRNFVAIPTALYFLIRFYVTDIKTMNWLLWVIIISTSIMSVMGCVEFLHTHLRISSTLDAGHAGSVVMTIGMFSGVYLFARESRIRIRSVLLLSIFLNFVGVVLGLGRIMIPAIIVLPFVILFIKKSSPSMLPLFMAFFLLAGFAAPLKVKIYDEGIKAFQKQQRQGIDPRQIDRVTDMGQTKAALGVRTLPYYKSIDFIVERPILGYGYSIHKYLKEHKGFPLAHSHNVGLDILLRTGFIGFIYFVCLMLVFTRYVSDQTSLSGKSSDSSMIFISLVFIILANSFANSMPNLAICCGFWLSIALAVTAKTILSDK